MNSPRGGSRRHVAPIAAVPATTVALCVAALATNAFATAEPPPMEPRILSAYYGLDELPAPANALCGSNVAGQDGLPVAFSVQLNADTVLPEAFAVETASGDLVTPVCATLRPAVEPLELRTVLLVGTFGTPDAQPRAVVVVGGLEDVDGQSLSGLRLDTVTPLEAGPLIVLAERFDADAEGLARECPTGTTQIVQLTWEGGVSGPDGAALGEPQRLAVSILLENGENVTPIALGEDDPDNYVFACIDAASPARSVTVEAGFFHDPGDDPNPVARIQIVPGEF